MTLDLRLALPASAAWVGAAVVWGLGPATALRVALVSAAVVALAMFFRRYGVAAAGVGLSLAAASTSVHLWLLHSGPVADLAGTRRAVDLSLTLVRDPTARTSAQGHGFVLADATVTTVNGRGARAPVLVLTHAPGWLDLLPGQHVRTRGRLQPPRAGDDVSAVVIAGPPHVVGRPPLWQRAAGLIRARLRRACAWLPADPRGLVPGLVDGDTSRMPASLTDAFRVSGLTHLNAVSGENCAIVLGAAAALLRRTPVPRAGRIAILAATLAAFVLVARPSPSVLRAAVMGAVALVAMSIGRRTQPVPLLSAAVLLLVLVDPYLARTPGFALSVLATAGIVLLAPPITRMLSRRLPAPVALAIAVPAAAQVVCTPVLVVVFGQLTPWAVVANVLAAPAVAPATLAGIATAVIALVAPQAASVVAVPAAAPAWALAFVARSIASLPGSHARWPAGWTGGGLLLGLSLLLGALVAARRRSLRHAMLGRWPP